MQIRQVIQKDLVLVQQVGRGELLQRLRGILRLPIGILLTVAKLDLRKKVELYLYKLLVIFIRVKEKI